MTCIVVGKEILWKSMGSISCLITFTCMHLADAKRLTVHSGYTCLLSVCVFPGNWAQGRFPANVMLYHWATETPTFFKISTFMFNIRKNLVWVWNDMRVCKWCQKFHFWVNYPFNLDINLFGIWHFTTWTNLALSLKGQIISYFKTLIELDTQYYGSEGVLSFSF